MKLQYIGPKGKQIINFPIGVKNRSGVHETKIVKSGEEFELSDEDGQKLLDLDAEIRPKKECSLAHLELLGKDPSVTEVEDGKIRRQVNYRLCDEGEGPKEKPLIEDTGEATLTAPPKKKKRGRPRKVAAT